MIHINRDAPREGYRISPTQSWLKVARAATEVAIREGRRHKADDSVYGHADVRAALEELFHHKCAYCESALSAGFDWDVEHFRPKGRVKGCPKHPGYYWLAYAWENLCPSCTHCNQNRTEKPLYGDPTRRPARGKVDQFPLRDESKRAMSHLDDVTSEDPLLIDPCRDDPETYLMVTATGRLQAIGDTKKGKTTIKVMNLNRRRLVKARRKMIDPAKRAMNALLRAKQADNQEAVAICVEILRKLTADDFWYAAVARSVERNPELFGLR